MKVISINVGRIAPLFVDDRGGGKKQVMTAIRKMPVSTLADPQPITVEPLGLTGDEQFDHSVHGGRDKAVYAYPYEHYPIWETMRLQTLKLGESLPHGFMGENLTLMGLNETQVWVGDVLHMGAAKLRVASPRQPCFKFNARMGFKQASKMMVQSGFTGFYLEVMQKGSIRAGDAITISPGDRVVRLDEMHRMLTKGKQGDLL
jgi:MOSC domain-containing protein YiiM